MKTTRVHQVLFLFLLCFTGISAAGEAVWIEGEDVHEKPAPMKKKQGIEALPGAGAGWSVGGWGHKGVVSNDSMLNVNLTARQVETYLPDEGMVFGYRFVAASTAEYEVWARIGFERVRSPFQWRLDGGAWRTVQPTDATINIREVSRWCELAWYKLTSKHLSEGNHTLEFRLRALKKGDRTDRILFLLDAVCIASPSFTPCGKWNPNVDHRTAKDREAEKTVFGISVPSASSAPARTELNGLWQYAPWEETQFPISEKTRTEPVTELPQDLEQLRWFAFTVPNAREALFPPDVFAHRYLLRCRLRFPEAASKKSVVLDVQRSNLIVSVFVNGSYAGGTDVFHTAWQMDLTRHVVPGEVNELVLCIKDSYYSLNPAWSKDAQNSGLGNRHFWNIPLSMLNDNMGVCELHDYPVAADPRSGILEPAAVEVAGAVSTSDVFIKPDVADKKLELELTLANFRKNRTVTVQNKVVPYNDGKGGEAVLVFPKQTVTIPQGRSSTLALSKQWNNPHLWWPDDPHLYVLETTIADENGVLETRRTRFGFRQWDWSTHMFRLNGVKWPLWADLSVHGKDPRTQVAASKKSHQNNMRYWHQGGLGRMTRREALAYFDKTGMIVRSSGTFDGQRANYGALFKKRAGTPDGERFWSNWRRQLAAWVKEERNHPCVVIWSLENEIIYINANNLGQLAETEKEIAEAGRMVLSIDPTRPVMVDGGNCLTIDAMPVNGAHYTEKANKSFRDFPDAAYDRELFYRGRFRSWPFIRNKPIFQGEVYFAAGYDPADFAAIGGASCYIGVSHTAAARSLWAKILSEGWRWSEVAAWQFWMGAAADHDYWNSWSPVALLSRQWNWSWGERQPVERHLRLFNNTHLSSPITCSWKLLLDGKTVAGDSAEFTVAAGEAKDWTVRFQTPEVAERTEGTFELTALRGGKVVFSDREEVSLLAEESLASPPSDVSICVYDPEETITGWFKKRVIPFVSVSKYGSSFSGAEVIVIGRNALTPDRSTDSYLLSLAAEGRRIIVLEQAYPLSFDALPADLQPTTFDGRIAFAEDLSHPAMHGLKQKDFFTWGHDHVCYVNAYKKGTKGGRSLVQCDEGLGYTALFESKVNDGVLVLCQLAVGEKINTVAAASQLFNNLLCYAAKYRVVKRQVATVLPQGDPRSKLLEDLDVKSEQLTDPRKAFEMQEGILVVDATPANLKTLAASKKKVEEFCSRGNYLMLWNVEPDGLRAFNELVECNHVLRPFSRERVVLAFPRDPLAAGLTLRDVVMKSTEKIWNWRSDRWFSDTIFTHIVDHTDIAPFCTFPTSKEMGKGPGPVNNDHIPRNMVNGFTSDDGWVYTYTTIIAEGHKTKFTLALPKEEELVSLKMRPSKLYDPLTKVKIYFDDDPEPSVAEIPVFDNPRTVDIPIEGKKARRITLEMAGWEKRSERDIVVIDNLWLQVKRSGNYLDRVHSLLNIGGLMRYRIGKGAIVLNQLYIPQREANPENAQKKGTIVKTLLANMGAVFTGSETKVARRHFRYRPVTFPDNAFNVFVDLVHKPGWFTEGWRFSEDSVLEGTDLSSLPVGEQEFAGVPYVLSDFKTSPLPSAIVASGREGVEGGKRRVSGLSVGMKADRLFFLHTYNSSYRVKQWLESRERAKSRNRQLPKPLSVASYGVQYDDGTTGKVDVIYEDGIGDWNCRTPRPFQNAHLAYVGKAKTGSSVSVWSMPWDNPHPEKEIASISVETNAGCGSIALFAVAVAEKVE